MPNRAAIAAATEHRDVAEEAFHVLHFNQELVQFADTKAGTLIVINSLFIAAAQAVVGGKSPVVTLSAAVAVLAAALAIFFCFSVVSTRFSGPQAARNDLVFFGDITRRASAEQYASDFFAIQGATQVEDVLRRTYVVAGIAQRKFAAYSTAQFMTGLSGAAWVIFNVLSLVFH